MSSKNRRLSDTERSYLEDGAVPEDSKYRPHELENRIEEKVEHLPDRLTTLFDDVELLDRGYFESDPSVDPGDLDSGDEVPGERYSPLATESGYRGWLNLMGFDEQPTKQKIAEEFSYTTAGGSSAPARFGAHLGRMVNRLMRWPDFGGIENEDVAADLVWGFLKGLVFYHRKAGDVTEEVIRDESDDILQRLHDRAEIYAEARRSMDGLAGILSGAHEKTELREEMAQRVGDILLERTSGTSRPVFSEMVERHADGGRGGGGLFYDVVDHLVDREIDNDHSYGSFKQWSAFCEKQEPLESFDVEAFLTEERVLSIVEERRLVERALLQKILDADAEALAEKTWRGVSASSILPLIVEEEPISSKALAKEIETADYEGSITGLAKQLAGRDTWPEGVTVFISRPILQGDPTGWQLTRYGQAAAYALRIVEARDEHYAQPIELKQFPEDLLLDALDEVGPSTEMVKEHAREALDD